MKAPRFWQHRGALWPVALLAPVGWIYGRITLWRMGRPGWRAPVPVVSVGNFTVGGAGKTPTTLALAKAFHARGERVFILSRGYGGREIGPYRVKTEDDSGQVGDEPRLMAQHAPVVIGKDRAAAARLAISQGASLLLLDDALQNPQLVKDFSLAVIDGGFGFGNGCCLPAGPLRAPVRPSLAHIDAALLIGADKTDAASGLLKAPYQTRINPDPVVAARLAGQNILAFCGIAHPEKFARTLQEIGVNLIATQWFEDHAPFSEQDAADLLSRAARLNALLVTTEKDAVRLTSGSQRELLRRQAIILPISITIPDALLDAIQQAVDAARRRTSTASGDA
ncbi:LpxK Tetraacyldisaccharide-1-P 4'-kinase [Rhabdaerophilaceae bacterium]